MVNIVAVCRGAPGLGRVVPALALTRTLAAVCGPGTVTFASYGAGAQFLASLGETVVDLGEPDGLFIDSVDPQALGVQDLVQDSAADLVLIDGEFFLPVTLAHLDVPVVYLANPHDLNGPPNAFRRVNRLLLSYCDAVLISSLGCPEPTPRPELIPGTVCLEVPALCQDIPLCYQPAAGAPRVLVTTGGGHCAARSSAPRPTRSWTRCWPFSAHSPHRARSALRASCSARTRPSPAGGTTWLGCRSPPGRYRWRACSAVMTC